MPSIIRAENIEHYQAGAELFNQYADSLDFKLTFQNFEEELQTIPVMYGSPKGALFLVEDNDLYIGVAGLRQIENEYTCEVKRMFILPQYQGKGIGKLLLNTLIQEAQNLNYQHIKLDTLGPKMPAAVALYKSFGFKETKPYNYNPYDGVIYFSKDLTQPD
jgi:putative acetyltransferase